MNQALTITAAIAAISLSAQAAATTQRQRDGIARIAEMSSNGSERLDDQREDAVNALAGFAAGTVAYDHVVATGVSLAHALHDESLISRLQRNAISFGLTH